MNLLSFEDVMKKLNTQKRKINFLMGNGFSMAYDSGIFSYNALQKFVEAKDENILNDIFKVFETSNFELIMQQLDRCKQLAERFKANQAFINNLNLATIELQKNLIDAINELHPEHVFKVSEEKSKKCALFFEQFLKTKGEIFSTNYDLLLYWVLMRNSINDVSDGFGKEYEEYNDYLEYLNRDDSEPPLTWGKHKEIQNVHFVHGALPLFDCGTEIIKETYTSERCIMKNIKERIYIGHYPIFVTAGDGKEKLKQIKHNPYLSYCYDKLSNIDGSLVTFGFNFGEYDEHIIKAINRASKFSDGNKLYSVYIGVYFDSDKRYIEDIEDKFKCKVHVYDSKTANIWS